LSVHRQNHARNRQPRIQLALYEIDRVKHLREALERVVLGLNRHDHAVGGHERVDRERAEPTVDSRSG